MVIFFFFLVNVYLQKQVCQAEKMYVLVLTPTEKKGFDPLFTDCFLTTRKREVLIGMKAEDYVLLVRRTRVGSL